MYNDFYNKNMNQVTTQTAGSGDIDTAEHICETGNQKARKRPKRCAAGFMAFGLCCAILGGAIGSAITAFGGAENHVGSQPETTIYTGTRPTIVSTADVDGKQILSATEVYASGLKSVVGINGNVTTNIWGQTVSNAVSGSGFVISADGYILTNYHVVNGVSNITVFFADGNSYDATVVGGEEDNDIAVLKIDAVDLQPVVLGDSDSIMVGENVYAIGNPLGELTFTLTGGLVSAKDRSVTTSDGTVMNMIQTDAAINSGNSGGPLFDQYGQTIGIVSAKLSSSNGSSSSIEGLGFAIPINDVKSMIISIIQNGYVTGKPSLGIITGNVNSFSFAHNGSASGCQVLAVLEGSCAAQGGLQKGDIITGVNDAEITSFSELTAAIKNYHAGDKVSLTVTRDGQSITLNIILDEENQKRQTDMTNLQEQYESFQQITPFGGYGSSMQE